MVGVARGALANQTGSRGDEGEMGLVAAADRFGAGRDPHRDHRHRPPLPAPQRAASSGMLDVLGSRGAGAPVTVEFGRRVRAVPDLQEPYTGILNRFGVVRRQRVFIGHPPVCPQRH